VSKIKEDMTSVVPANAAGDGAIAGLGIGSQGEPGVYVKKKKKLRQIVMNKVPIRRQLPK
jgi:hypothetical protein